MFRRTAAPAFACVIGLASMAGPAHAQNDRVQVVSAILADRPIDNATVSLQRADRPSLVATTDAQGRATLDPVLARDPQSRLVIGKPGYAELIVQCPCDVPAYALSPVMHNLDGMRVVLSWGDTPADLDAHLSYPGNHVYFERKSGRDAGLDLDHSGQRGPETITVQRRHPGESYTFAVHDFGHRDQADSRALARSQAQVFVYVGESLVRSYRVPRDQAGNLWTVFRVDGEGRFDDLNAISALAVGAERIGDEIERVGGHGGNEPVGSEAGDAAIATNLRGEAAYRNGDLRGAVALYQQAIELDPAHALSYSNLGLAYVKLGRAAEAIWASRKAIALAKGAGAATIRAGAYYNIGKLYEEDGQYERAMSNYLAAKREKPDKTYDQALERVSGY